MDKDIDAACGTFTVAGCSGKNSPETLALESIQLVLPRRLSITPALASEDKEAHMYCGNETVLLAEDNILVREMTAKAFRKRGYAVIEAADGLEALRMSELHEDRFALLITDVIMPRMGGLELALRLRSMRPEIGILMFSGYSEMMFCGELLSLPNAAMILKPFLLTEMFRCVRELIDASQQPACGIASGTSNCRTSGNELRTAA